MCSEHANEALVLRLQCPIATTTPCHDFVNVLLAAGSLLMFNAVCIGLVVLLLQRGATPSHVRCCHPRSCVPSTACPCSPQTSCHGWVLRPEMGVEGFGGAGCS